jgi:hypothetical protein
VPGPIAAAAGEDVAQGREGRPSSLVIPLTTSLSVRPRPPRLHDVEGNAEPYEAIAEAGPEALGASPDRGGIDDAEGGGVLSGVAHSAQEVRHGRETHHGVLPLFRADRGVRAAVVVAGQHDRLVGQRAQPLGQ